MKLFVLGTLARAQQGAILVEFALVAPLFLGMLFGIVEFGRASWTLLALQQTATVGARCMALPQSACASDVTYAYNATKTVTYIKQVANQWGVSLSSADIAPNNAANCGGKSGVARHHFPERGAAVGQHLRRRNTAVRICLLPQQLLGDADFC